MSADDQRQKSKERRIDNMRRRLAEAQDVKALRDVLKGVLDLLGDEL